MTEKIITVFGTSRVRQADAVYDLAFQTGRVIAQAGFTVANGGYGGTMLATAKGSARAGGQTIGVTCSAFKAGKANEYISREIVTNSLDERLDKLIELGAGYVVLPGGTGTLLELAKVWELKNKGFLNGPKPIILISRFWKPLIELIATDDLDSRSFINQVDQPQQIREIILAID
jgi:uncharacterized protein (TIGR00730 family)